MVITHFNAQYFSFFMNLKFLNRIPELIKEEEILIQIIELKIIFRLKSLTNQQKSDVMSIRSNDFILKFFKLVDNPYTQRINIKNSYTILNIFSNKSVQQKFQKIKKHLKVALTSDPIIYLSFDENQICQKFYYQWLEQVTDQKIFQYANKLSNKQQIDDNLLWINTDSYHTLYQLFVNEVQKSILKHFFRRQLVSVYKFKQLKQYIQKKNQTQVKLLSLTLQEAKKLSNDEIQAFSLSIKNYQNSYYDDVRQNLIESLQILQGLKDAKKKRKNKRKQKAKKTSCSPTNNLNQYILNDVISPHKKTHSESDHQNLNDEEQIVYQAVPQIFNDQNSKNEDQSTGNFQIQYQNIQKQIHIQQTTQEEVKQIAKQRQVENQKIQTKKNKNQSQQGKKKLKCKQISISVTSAVQVNKKLKQKGNGTKNLVTNSNRSMSPHTKSNTLDNNCSKSMLSGEVFQTFTQAVRQQDKIKAAQQLQFQNYQEDMLQQSVFTNEVDEQRNQNKRKKKKKNNNVNKLIEEMGSKCTSGLINKQLTNFIDNLSIQTNGLYESKIICFQRIRYFIKTLYPQTEIMLFGSNALGLSLPSSDIDVSLYNIKGKQSYKDVLAQIAIQINARAWIVSCSTYLNAKTPLVKLQIDPLIAYTQMKRRSDPLTYYDMYVQDSLDIKDRKKARNMFVDITVNQEFIQTGISPSTEFMKTYMMNENPTLQNMIIVFKYVLSKHDYNKNFQGGLGSYCLFIMIAAYFEQFKETIPSDEGLIFLDIIKFYSEDFQNKQKSITLRKDGSCFMSLEETLGMSDIPEMILSNPLRIIDPLTKNLMSSSCCKYQFIKSQFQRIRKQILQEFENIQKQITSNYTLIQLNKMIANPKSIEKWINKYQNRSRFSIKRVIDGKAEERQRREW